MDILNLCTVSANVWWRDRFSVKFYDHDATGTVQKNKVVW